MTRHYTTTSHPIKIAFILLIVVLVPERLAFCLADGMAAVPVGGAAGFDPHSYVVGWEFTVSAAVQVTNLAYLDASGGGLSESHMVGIFDANTQNLLVSATVPAGPATPSIDGFRISPAAYALQPGTYVIAGLRATNLDAALVRATNVTLAPQITFVQERELLSSTFGYPSSSVSGDEDGDFGPSFTIAGGGSAATITGITSAGSFQPLFAAGTYISIFGTGLSNTSRAWTLADFSNGANLPTSLDGVSVTVGGIPAYVEYVSPGQLNIVIPDMTAAGSGVPVVVTPPGGSPITTWINVQPTAPAFFTWPTGTADSGKYIVAQHADYTNVGKSGLFPQQAANFTSPAHAGETIIIYGTGFGPTNPQISSGVLASKAYALNPLPTLTIGGVTAQVLYAGLVPGLAGIYQLNVAIPSSLANGDWPVVASIGGVTSYSSLVTIQN